jgi:hypothetical protein
MMLRNIWTSLGPGQIFWYGPSYGKGTSFGTWVPTGIWWGDPRGSDHLGDRGVDGKIILKCIFKKWDEAWTGLTWLRIWIGGGLL